MYIISIMHAHFYHCVEGEHHKGDVGDHKLDAEESQSGMYEATHTRICSLMSHLLCWQFT